MPNIIPTTQSIIFNFSDKLYTIKKKYIYFYIEFTLNVQ